MDKFDEKVIGYDSIKETLRQIADVLKRPEAYKEKGVSMPRGLLMESAPGLGKSLMASILMEESGRKSFVFRRINEGNTFLGEMKDIFDVAKEEAPSILLLEDLNLYVESNSPYAPEWACLQACIDETSDADIFVIATTNDTRYMPQSLLRPGRFDYILNLNPPLGKTAEDIVSYYLRDKNLAKDVQISDIVEAVYHNRLGAVVTDIAQLEQEEYEKQKRAIEATNTTQIKKLYTIKQKLENAKTHAEFDKLLQEISAVDAEIDHDNLTSEQKTHYDQLNKSCTDTISAKMRQLEYKDNIDYNKKAVNAYNSAFTSFKNNESRYKDIPGFQNPIELQPFRAKNGCTGVGFLHDMGSRVLGLDVANLTVNALLCRRDAAIAIDVHASPFWLKDNERHF